MHYLHVKLGGDLCERMVIQKLEELSAMLTQFDVLCLQVDALYNRDIARMGGPADSAPDEDYKQFMSEIGMPQSSGRPSGGDSFSRPHPGLGLERYALSACKKSWEPKILFYSALEQLCGLIEAFSKARCCVWA